MRFFLVAPWKFAKGSLYEALFSEYISRISRQESVTVLQPQSSLASETACGEFLFRTLDSLPQATWIWYLDERGKSYSSEEWAKNLDALELQGFSYVALVLGGAYGLPANLAKLKRPMELLSLSSLTFPHELALLIVSEQLYRLQCIRRKHPYHHGEKSALSQALKRT